MNISERGRINGGKKKLMIIAVAGVARPRGASADLRRYCLQIVEYPGFAGRGLTTWQHENRILKLSTKRTHYSRHTGRRLERFVPPDRRGNRSNPISNK
jgi:hypothetical protein